MKKKVSSLAMAAAMLLLLAACGAKTSDSAENSAGYDQYSSVELPAESTAVSKDSYMTTVESDIYDNAENKIIRTATMYIQTTEFEEAVAGLAQLTESKGGYYETAEMYGGSYYSTHASRSAYYVVRIPKENFVAFRDAAGGIGYLCNIQEGTKDVGETYYDTEARLATLTTKRDRLLALLEEATVMEDIITLENALADVMYEIDMHTATLRKYDSLINYSTFTITIDEVTRIVEEPGVEDSFGTKLAANLKEGFERFGENLQDFVLWFANNLIGIVIFVAVICGGLLLVRRMFRRRKERRTDA